MMRSLGFKMLCFWNSQKVGEKVFMIGRSILLSWNSYMVLPGHNFNEKFHHYDNNSTSSATCVSMQDITMHNLESHGLSAKTTKH